MLSRRTVHVVDDDEDVRESAALLLESAGFSVIPHSSGAEFLDKTDFAVPACILLDIHMPQIDGLQVQRRLAARGIGFPVIVLTGQGDISIAVQAMKNGAFEFLEKPYLNDVLLEAVRDAFTKLETITEDRASTADASGVAAGSSPRSVVPVRSRLMA